MRRQHSARQGLIRKAAAVILAAAALLAGGAQLGLVSAQIPGTGVPEGELPTGEGVLSVGVVGIAATPLPLFAKLSPAAWDVAETARAAASA